MPDVSTMVYHGIRQNVRRVLEALGPERVEKGLTAFDDGESNWDQCFFARAFQGEARLGRHNGGHIDPTNHICLLLGDPKLTLRVPVQLLWHAFDKMAGPHWTREEMRKFVNDVLDESRPAEVIELLRSINVEAVEKMEFSCINS